MAPSVCVSTFAEKKDTILEILLSFDSNGFGISSCINYLKKNFDNICRETSFLFIFSSISQLYDNHGSYKPNMLEDILPFLVKKS